jgi:hypothetical protein
MSSMKYSGVLSNSAITEATKFTGPHKSRMRQYIINLVHQGQTIGPELTQAGATIFEDPNMKIDHSQPSLSVFSTFPELPHPISYRAINLIANINHIKSPS